MVPGVITLALGADKGFNFEIDLSPRRRSAVRRRARPSTRRASSARSPWTIAASGSGSRTNACRAAARLAAEDVDVGDHDAVVRRSSGGGRRGRVTTLNLGLVTRAAGRRRRRPRWPYLLRLLLRYFALGARRRAVQLGLRVLRRRQPRPSDEDLHRDNDNVAPSRLMAVGDFAGGGRYRPGEPRPSTCARGRTSRAAATAGRSSSSTRSTSPTAGPYTGGASPSRSTPSGDGPPERRRARVPRAPRFRLKECVDAPVVTPPSRHSRTTTTGARASRASAPASSRGRPHPPPPPVSPAPRAKNRFTRAALPAARAGR